MDDIRQLIRSRRIRVAIDPEALPAPDFTGTDWDRVAGMLEGLAIGDSLGNTSESRLPADRGAAHGEIRDYLPNRHACHERVGLPSDDTPLAFRTLEHLLENAGNLDPAKLADTLASGPIFGLGSTVRSFLAARGESVHWLDAAQESAGNGALMRIAPILLPHLSSPGSRLWRDAVVASAVTHNDFASNASCAAFVAVLVEALGARPPVPRMFWLERFIQVAGELEGRAQRYVPRAPRYAHRRVSLAAFTREVVGQALEADLPAVEACNAWHSGAFLLETVPSVLYILERHGNDPEAAIVRAVNDTRDNDTIGAIVGAAVGALHGLEALPRRWRDGLLGRTDAGNDRRVFELVERARGRPNEDPEWLHRYVQDAVRRKLCTKVYCTTCGSTEFRDGWRAALAWASRYCANDRVERARVLAAGLARVQPESQEQEGRVEDAVRLLLFKMRSEGSLMIPACREILNGSWAGRVLVRMEEHYRADRDRAAKAVLSQEELQAAAAKRRKEREERHRARLAAKVEKDRAWRATHDVPPPRNSAPGTTSSASDPMSKKDYK